LVFAVQVNCFDGVPGYQLTSCQTPKTRFEFRISWMKSAFATPARERDAHASLSHIRPALSQEHATGKRKQQARCNWPASSVQASVLHRMAVAHIPMAAFHVCSATAMARLP